MKRLFAIKYATQMMLRRNQRLVILIEVVIILAVSFITAKTVVTRDLFKWDMPNEGIYQKYEELASNLVMGEDLANTMKYLEENPHINVSIEGDSIRVANKRSGYKVTAIISQDLKFKRHSATTARVIIYVLAWIGVIASSVILCRMIARIKKIVKRNARQFKRDYRYQKRRLSRK